MSPLFAAVRRTALLCLPFAAVFLAGVTLSTSVFAQYPGGGSGSGGSGGSYPGSPGWAALPRPGNAPATPYRFQDYDWTGMPVTLTVTDYLGQVYDYSYTAAPNIGYGGTYPIHDMTGGSSFTGVGSGSGAAASSHCQVSGAATYKWRWTPPLNAARQPDLVNFPAPPLFVLGRVDGHISTGLMDPTNAKYLTASGTLNDGFSDGWGGSVSGYPQYVPAGGGSGAQGAGDGAGRVGRSDILGESVAELDAGHRGAEYWAGFDGGAPKPDGQGVRVGDGERAAVRDHAGRA